MLRENQPGLGDKLDLATSDLSIDLAKAERDFRALTALHRFFADDASPIAALLDEIGDVHNHAGRSTKALEQYGQALEIRRKIRGGLHPDVALSHHKLASGYQGQGKEAEATEESRQAVLALRVPPGKAGATPETLESDDLVPLPITSEILYDHGLRLGRAAGATPTASQLRTCAPLRPGCGDPRSGPHRSPRDGDEQGPAGCHRYDLIARRVGISRRLFEAERKSEDLRAAFEAAEQGLARVFLEGLGRTRAEIIGKISQPLRDSETELLARLRRLDADVARELSGPHESQDVDRLARLFDLRKEAERQQKDVVASMEKENPQFAALKYPRPCSLEEARSCLDSDEAALIYIPGSEKSYLIVVAREADPHTAGIAIHELASAGDIAAILGPLKRPGALGISRDLEPVDPPRAASAPGR